MKECHYGGHVRSKLTILLTSVVPLVCVYAIAAITTTATTNDNYNCMKFLVITVAMGETAF